MYKSCYLCGKGGWIFILDCTGRPLPNSSVFIKGEIFITERHLMDPVGKDARNRTLTVPLSCIRASKNYFFLGSTDGVLRIITRCDPNQGSSFGDIILEAEHDASLDDLSVDMNEQYVFISTPASFGRLDIEKRQYETITRTHTNK